MRMEVNLGLEKLKGLSKKIQQQKQKEKSK
jgi:hypothetical protein